MPSLAMILLTASRKPESARLDSTCARVERVIRGYLRDRLVSDTEMCKRGYSRQGHGKDASSCPTDGMGNVVGLLCCG